MGWRSCRKFDGHVHVLPDERAAQFLANEGRDAPWARCGAEDYLRRMDRYGVEKALLVPANDPYLYYQDPRDTNRFLGALVKAHPDRFCAFADVTASGAYFIEQTPWILEEAVEEYGLCGLKLHPTNLHMDADDLRLVPVLRKAAELGVQVDFFQSNHEGDIIDALHRADCDGIVLNAGAYTHTSLAIADAIKAIQIPVIEVHISNVASREPIRHTSLIAPVCLGSIAGFGLTSYFLAAQAIIMNPDR